MYKNHKILPVYIMSETLPIEFSEEHIQTQEYDSVSDGQEPEVYFEDIYDDQSENNKQEYSILSHQIETIEFVLESATISEKEEPEAEPIIMEKEELEVPSIIFIVPYRDREIHQRMFASIMKDVMKDSEPYKIYYVHQTDSRGFNRGAMKNIGFLAVKNMYPNDYKNITLVFNDIDTMPNKNTILNYKTSRGNIKHFYGFDYTLGGIVSILACDFEQLNGFPNFWAWGYEDNMLQTRAKTNGFVIDRSVFYKIQDPNIIHLTDTPIRKVNRAEFDRFLQNTTEGIHSIEDLKYEVNEETGFIDVLSFNTTTQEMVEKRVDYDLRNGPAPFKEVTQPRRVPRMRMQF